MNSFGTIFRLTDFGETHGKAMGGVIDGCPAGLELNLDFIQQELNRRAPGRHEGDSQRKESDKVEFIAGVVDGKTTGAPLAFLIYNTDVQENEENLYVLKPSHASYVYKQKYGANSNRACGRSSGRQTVCRVVAGAIAKQILEQYKISIKAHVISCGQPDKEGDTFGAKVGCVIKNIPAGLGEPVYDKFHARLGYAMLSINAAKSFEIGEGFKAAEMCGSEYNDVQTTDFSYLSNHDGGVQAGITNGQEVVFAVAFKPIPTTRFEQETIDFKGNSTIYKGNNRNDLSVVPRVLPVVEAMTAMVVLDFLLISKTQQ